MSETPPGKSKRGCFFYGCITFVVLTLLIILGLFLTTKFLVNKFQSLTDTAPTPLQIETIPDAELQALENRIDDFKNAVEAGNPTEPLILTARDLNALLSRDAQWRGRLQVDLVEDKVVGKVSIPMDIFEIKIPMDF